MNDDESQEVFGAIAVAVVLSVCVMVTSEWDRLRCWLPDVPRFEFHNSSTQGPTPIEEPNHADAVDSTDHN